MNPQQDSFRRRLARIIFEADTPAGKGFDLALIFFICLSVLVVMADSVAVLRSRYGIFFWTAEWFFTLVFSVEYGLRLFTATNPLAYCRSFFGLVDLLAILPTYLSLIFPGSQYLLVIRVLRVLRVFRVLKLAKFLAEANLLLRALAASRRKILVFLFTVVNLVIICGSLMYLIEPPESGFTSIPRSIYWAIVTLTTVGYGDISPHSSLGQCLASLIMILGYGIIAVPTGIVSVELSRVEGQGLKPGPCRNCNLAGHQPDARFCRVCGASL